MQKNWGKYLLVVDGSIPLKDDGIYSTIAGITNLAMLKEVAAGAAAIISVGTCAAYGGLPMVIETWYGLGLHKVCERHVKLRQRQKGLSDAQWAKLGRTSFESCKWRLMKPAPLSMALSFAPTRMRRVEKWDPE